MSGNKGLRWVARVFDGLKKVREGVPLGGERVWPGLRNDLLVAHRSIYDFFSQFCEGHRVLDAGCGLGYGSLMLAETGSRHVCGVDSNAPAIRYAKRHYQRQNLDFRVEDCEALPMPDRPWDRVVSSNMLEHLEFPEKFLNGVARALSPTGALILAVPPITNPRLLEDNLSNPHHLSNYTVGQWIRLFEEQGWTVGLYRHSHPRLEELDLSSRKPSRFREEEFLFEPTDLSGISRQPTLTALFYLTR